mgnify:CR=1 FL=1
MIPVGSKSIWRGPRPETYEQWAELKSAGVKTIINLERGWFDWFHGKTNFESNSASRLEITHIQIQLGDVFAPSAQDLWTALRYVKCASKLGGVYIHCLHGKDRTGMVCAMIRRHWHQWDSEQAIQEMMQNGFHRWPYEPLGWVKRLRRCL